MNEAERARRGLRAYGALTDIDMRYIVEATIPEPELAVGKAKRSADRERRENRSIWYSQVFRTVFAACVSLVVTLALATVIILYGQGVMGPGIFGQESNAPTGVHGTGNPNDPNNPAVSGGETDTETVESEVNFTMSMADEGYRVGVDELTLVLTAREAGEPVRYRTDFGLISTERDLYNDPMPLTDVTPIGKETVNGYETVTLRVKLSKGLRGETFRLSYEPARRAGNTDAACTFTVKDSRPRAYTDNVTVTLDQKEYAYGTRYVTVTITANEPDKTIRMKQLMLQRNYAGSYSRVETRIVGASSNSANIGSSVSLPLPGEYETVTVVLDYRCFILPGEYRAWCEIADPVYVSQTAKSVYSESATVVDPVGTLDDATVFVKSNDDIKFTAVKTGSNEITLRVRAKKADQALRILPSLWIAQKDILSNGRSPGIFVDADVSYDPIRIGMPPAGECDEKTFVLHTKEPLVNGTYYIYYFIYIRYDHNPNESGSWYFTELNVTDAFNDSLDDVELIYAGRGFENEDGCGNYENVILRAKEPGETLAFVPLFTVTDTNGKIIKQIEGKVIDRIPAQLDENGRTSVEFSVDLSSSYRVGTYRLYYTGKMSIEQGAPYCEFYVFESRYTLRLNKSMIYPYKSTLWEDQIVQGEVHRNNWGGIQISKKYKDLPSISGEGTLYVDVFYDIVKVVVYDEARAVYREGTDLSVLDDLPAGIWYVIFDEEYLPHAEYGSIRAGWDTCTQYGFKLITEKDNAIHAVQVDEPGKTE